jgi:VWFA-related protein
MRIRNLSFLVVLSCIARAQTPNPAEVAAQDTSITFQSKVNIVLVPVVVRDKTGKPVDNLTKEDFLLFDKGRAQTVSRVSIERAGAKTTAPTPDAVKLPEEKKAEAATPGPPAPEHFIAFFFDDIHIQFSDLVLVRQAAEKYLASSFKQQDRAAIYTSSGQTTVDFTDDLDKLKDGLSKLHPRPVARPTSQECPDVSFYQGDLIVNKNDAQALNVAMRETMICMNLPTLEEARAPAQAAAYRAVSEGEHESRLALGTMKDLVRRMGAMPGQRLILMVSPGFLRLNEQLEDESDIIDRAIKSNVTISALDARGLYTDTSDIGKRVISIAVLQAKQQYERAASRASSDVMAELADATGGTFFENNNDLTTGMRDLAAVPEVYYILSFSPQNLKPDGSYHSLKVGLKNQPGASAKARRGYYAPRHSVNAEEAAKEEISQALFSREEMHEIPLELHTQYFMLNDDQASLDVIARVDIRKLHFRKLEGRNGDEMLVVSAIFDRNGNFLQAVTKKISMRLKDETLAGKVNSGIAVHAGFKVAPGHYLLRLVVRDSEGETMAAQNGAVEIP